MELNKSTYYEIDVSELEVYVKDLYGAEIEFVATEEWNNDTQHVFCNIDGVLDEWDSNRASDAIAGKNPMYCCRAVLNRLCGDGWLPTGDYLITVFW